MIRAMSMTIVPTITTAAIQFKIVFGFDSISIPRDIKAKFSANTIITATVYAMIIVVFMIPSFHCFKGSVSIILAALSRLSIWVIVFSSP